MIPIPGVAGIAVSILGALGLGYPLGSGVNNLLSKRHEQAATQHELASTDLAQAQTFSEGVDTVLAIQKELRENLAETKEALKDANDRLDRCRDESAILSQQLLDMKRTLADMQKQLTETQAQAQHDQRDLERKLRGEFDFLLQRKEKEYNRRIQLLAAKLGVEEDEQGG